MQPSTSGAKRGPAKGKAPSFAAVAPTNAATTSSGSGAPSAAHGAGETNIFVAIRVRPKTSGELSRGMGHTLEVLNDASTLIFDPAEAGLEMAPTTNGPTHRQKNQAFSFDCVLGPDATQEQVYNKTAKEVIPCLLDGFNASVFAYGQTSAGKTFTMLGDRVKGEGVMVRALKDLFDALAEEERKRATTVAKSAAGRTVEYALTFSYVEVYNESIRDLLSADQHLSATRDLELRDSPDGEVTVLGVSEHKPQSVQDVMALLERGNSNRSQSATDANETSSRSHAILQVHLRRTERKTVTGKVKTMIRRSKLSMIDLAGSERAKATVNREDALRKEGQNINKSLLALGNVINALSSGSTHVPFRDSKLTRLLKDSLGGNCRTIMIANVSPCFSNYEDTYSTLNYAKRAKNIRVTLSKAQLAVATSSDNFNLQQIEALRDENERLRKILREGAARGESSSSTSAAGGASVGVDFDAAAVEALAGLRADAEALFSQKLLLHRRAFAAWVQGQWARVKCEQLQRELLECHDNVRLDTLRASLGATQSQWQSYSFEMDSLRAQMVALESDVSALRDHSGAAWAVFRGGSERVKELKRAAELFVELQEGRCEAEMMRREVNVLRAMVEQGWELDECGHTSSFAALSSPQMTTGTPIWKKLSRGSPGLKMPLRGSGIGSGGGGRRKLELDESPAKPVAADPQPAPVRAPVQQLTLPAQPIVYRAEPSAEYREEFPPLPIRPAAAALVAPVTDTQKSISYSFYNDGASSPMRSPSFISVEDYSAPTLTSLTYGEQDDLGVSHVLRTMDDGSAFKLDDSSAAQPNLPSAVDANRSRTSGKRVDLSANDDVPVAVRSFGSALSMLHTLLPATSTAPATLAPTGPANATATTTAAATAAASTAPVRKSSVRERLQRMVRERVAAKKEEEDGNTANEQQQQQQQQPSNQQARPPIGVTVDELAFSPVEAARPPASSDALGSVSFAANTTPPPIHQLTSKATRGASMIPKPKTRAEARAEEENRINAAAAIPSAIPRPGSGGSNKKKALATLV